MRKELVWQEGELSFFLFKPDICHLYDKEKPGRDEPVHRYTLTHIIHQYIFLIGGVPHFILRKKIMMWYPMLFIRNAIAIFLTPAIKMITMSSFIIHIRNIEEMDIQAY